MQLLNGRLDILHPKQGSGRGGVSTTPPGYSRRLGESEKMFAKYNRNNGTNYNVSTLWFVSSRLPVSEGSLRACMRVLMDKHPLLRMGISEHRGHLYWTEAPGCEPRLRVDHSGDWRGAAENNLQQHFEHVPCTCHNNTCTSHVQDMCLTRAPLWRVTLLPEVTSEYADSRYEHHAALILDSHHAALDGQAIVRLVQEMRELLCMDNLASLSPVESLQVPRPLDSYVHPSLLFRAARVLPWLRALLRRREFGYLTEKHPFESCLLQGTAAPPEQDSEMRDINLESLLTDAEIETDMALDNDESSETKKHSKKHSRSKGKARADGKAKKRAAQAVIKSSAPRISANPSRDVSDSNKQYREWIEYGTQKLRTLLPTEDETASVVARAAAVAAGAQVEVVLFSVGDPSTGAPCGQSTGNATACDPNPLPPKSPNITPSHDESRTESNINEKRVSKTHNVMHKINDVISKKLSKSQKKNNNVANVTSNNINNSKSANRNTKSNKKSNKKSKMAAPQVLRTCLETQVFSQAATSAIVKACKANKVTVHCALQTAATVAICRLLVELAEERGLSVEDLGEAEIECSASLGAESCKGQIAENESYVKSLYYAINREVDIVEHARADLDFWQVAQELAVFLKDEKAGALGESHSWSVLCQDFGARIPFKRTNLLSITNLGNCNYLCPEPVQTEEEEQEEQGQHMRVTGLYCMTTEQQMGPIFNNSIIQVDSRLQWGCIYYPHVTSQQVARRYLSLCQELLSNYCGQPSN